MSFVRLKQMLAKEVSLVSPFLMLGDPTPELSVELARAAVDAGARVLELGFPYSDPCADGPAIQRACQRSLAGGTSTSGALAILSKIARACPDVPLNLLVYGNLAHRRGYDRFCSEVAQAGAASLLLPDIPVEEGGQVAEACAVHDLGLVYLVAPVTSARRRLQLQAAATGFLYLAGLQGVTGQEQDGEARRALVARVVESLEIPVCLGFGLSRPAHVRDAFAGGARIAVVGSLLARSIDAAYRDGAGSSSEILNAFSSTLEPMLDQQSL